MYYWLLFIYNEGLVLILCIIFWHL